MTCDLFEKAHSEAWAPVFPPRKRGDAECGEFFFTADDTDFTDYRNFNCGTKDALIDQAVFEKHEVSYSDGVTDELGTERLFKPAIPRRLA